MANYAGTYLKDYGGSTNVPEGTLLSDWGGPDGLYAPDNGPGPLPSQNSVLGESTTYSAPAPNPYAQWGGQDAYQNLIDSFNTRKSGILNSAQNWGQQNKKSYGDSITDYIDNLRQGQQGLNEQGVQNELGYKQGRSGILGMVAQGIRSGGVMLANRNASDSSASAALANAYGEIGRGQLSNVGNQYALENRNIGIEQGNFDTQAQAGSRRIQRGGEQGIAGKVDEARNLLETLDAWAADRSLPERIQVEQEKAKIQAQLKGMFEQHNSRLTSGVAGINPTSTEQRRSTATDLANDGVASTSPFSFNSETPTQFQNSAFSSNLPLFTSPRKRTA